MKFRILSLLSIWLFLPGTSSADTCASIQKNNLTSSKNMTERTYYSALPQKEWTFAVYIAADNDLNYFSGRNLDDMAQVGSNANLNIVAHLDRPGAYEKTKRLYVEKNRLVQVNANDPYSFQKLDSGNASTLIDFCEWTIKNYPAKHYALILWNHGSGILDNVGGRTVNPSELFIFNPQTNMLELDRSVSYLDFVQKKYAEQRAVCFSDTFKTFLSNQKLAYALKTVQQNALHGKKFDIIGYDACLMAMTEVADLIQPYANVGVFSQELELGSGWKYDEVLKPFLTRTMEPEEFAAHIVQVYSTYYQTRTADYTLSAVSLGDLPTLTSAIDTVSSILLQLVYGQQHASVTNAIKASKSKRLCTHFSEPSYLDLDHFLANIADTIDYMIVYPEKEPLKETLRQAIATTRQNLASCVIAHAEGKNLTRARGLSIYFPLRQVDLTYAITPFARTNKWLNLIETAV